MPAYHLKGATRAVAECTYPATGAPVTVLTLATFRTGLALTAVNEPPRYAAEQSPLAKAMLSTWPLTLGFQDMLVYGLLAENENALFG